MTLSVFASGSGGNCSLLSEGDSHVLLDDGISLRRLRAALGELGLTPEALGAVLITHEHKDHILGLPMLCRHWGVPVLAPRLVARQLCRSAAGVGGYLEEIPVGEPFSLGAFTVRAFHSSHDSAESVGYRLEGSGVFGLCTDTGMVTGEILEGLRGSGAALLEANHDPELLRAGPYPYPLKERILSRRGHLSNADCAALARTLAEGGTRRFILGHLSRENNTPELAESTVRRALSQAGFGGAAVAVAPVLGNLTVEIPPCCV